MALEAVVDVHDNNTVRLDEKARINGALNKATNDEGLFEGVKPVVAGLF
jgi:hypothetical protein